MSDKEVGDMVELLIRHYSLAELEDKLDLHIEDLEEGLLDYVESQYERVKSMLEEDLFL